MNELDPIKQLEQKGRKIWCQAQETSEDAWMDAKVWVRKNPAKALGYTFIAGLAFGAAVLQGRRRK